MTTQTKIFDFSYLKDKSMGRYKSLNKNERSSDFIGEMMMVGLHINNNIKEYPISANIDTTNTYTKGDTFFRQALHLIDLAHHICSELKNPYISVETIEVGKKFSLTYTTHNEPKEFLLHSYIGKETGNIYFSNQGDDIVFGNISAFTDIPFKSLISIFQSFKITGDITMLKTLLRVKQGGNSVDSPYLSIFTQTKTEQVTHNDELLSSIIYNLELNIDVYNSLSLCLRYLTGFAQYCVNYNVNKCSKISGDMVDLVDDFSIVSRFTKKKSFKSELLKEYKSLFDDGEMDDYAFKYLDGKTGAWENFMSINSEYTSQLNRDMISVNYNREFPIREYYKAVLQTSVLDNMSDDVSIYSEEIKDYFHEVAKDRKIVIDYKIMDEMPLRVLKTSYSRHNFHPKVNMQYNSMLLTTIETLYQEDKVSYKYIQRLHNILSKL